MFQRVRAIVRSELCALEPNRDVAADPAELELFDSFFHNIVFSTSEDAFGASGCVLQFCWQLRQSSGNESSHCLLKQFLRNWQLESSSSTFLWWSDKLFLEKLIFELGERGNSSGWSENFLRLCVRCSPRICGSSLLSSSGCCSSALSPESLLVGFCVSSNKLQCCFSRALRSRLLGRELQLPAGAAGSPLSNTGVRAEWVGLSKPEPVLRLARLR